MKKKGRKGRIRYLVMCVIIRIYMCLAPNEHYLNLTYQKILVQRGSRLSKATKLFLKKLKFGENYKKPLKQSF